MQDTRESFRKTKYTTTIRIQGFYDCLLDNTQNMAIYPDTYTILEEFLWGIPPQTHSLCLLEYGLSSKTNSLEDFVSIAKKIEQNEKTEAYYKGQYSKPAATTEGKNARVKSPPNDQKRVTQYNQVKPSVPYRHPFRAGAPYKPQRGNWPNEPVANADTTKQPDLHLNQKQDHNHKHEVKDTSSITCFNCSHTGHYAKDCPSPKKKKVHIRAVRSMMGGDNHEEADDEREDNQTEIELMTHQDNESAESTFEDETHKIGVPASDFYEDPDEEPDFLTVMDVIPLDEIPKICEETKGRPTPPRGEDKCNDIVAASTVSPRARARDKKDERRYKFQLSGKRRLRPAISQEEKECLATWVKVGDLEVWTLWDSGSTTTGITPAFAELAKIKVNTLEDLHILQLGS